MYDYVCMTTHNADCPSRISVEVEVEALNKVNCVCNTLHCAQWNEEFSI